MSTVIRNIVFATPEPPDELGAFYAHFLGWKVLRRDWFVIAPDEDTLPRLAFGDGPADYIPPRWPDPDFPQQMHLDIAVPDLEASAELAMSLGAARLKRNDAYSVFADPAGHPFCLYEPHDSPSVVSPQITHVVIDCFSPRALAGFYEEMLDMHRTDDSETWVVIKSAGGRMPNLSFQHAVFPPARWPDPRYPQQMHLDLHTEHKTAAVDLALKLGAQPLPPQGGSCPVFADPASHPFCICSPGE